MSAPLHPQESVPSADEVVARLRTSDLLAEVPDDLLREVAAGVTSVHLSRGEELLRQGEPADAMFLIVSGSVEVFAEVAGTDVPLAVSGPGSPLGEMALIAGRARSASARAVGEVELLRIDAAAFDRLLDSAQFARRLLLEASNRAEQRQLLTQQHTKMAALGQLTAGLLHELNNPTAALRRNAQELRSRLDAVRDADTLLEPAASAVARGIAASARPDAAPEDPLDRSDAEQRMQRWLTDRGVSNAWELAPVLVLRGLSVELLEERAAKLPPGAELEPVVRAVAAALEVDRLVDGLLDASQRISETVAGVRDYSHHGEAPLQDVVLARDLDRALNLLRHKVGDNVTVVRSYDESLPAVEGYPADLNSVWTNLLDNALDAASPDGTVTVRTRLRDGRAVVEVIDDGPGIPADFRSRVFDPFFTTKPVGAGTGLGLALARSIVVQRHNGDLTVESEPGRTVFRVELPLQQRGE